MMLPFVCDRNYYGTVCTSDCGYYWSSSPNSDEIGSRTLNLSPGGLDANSDGNRGVGMAVRCFKNKNTEVVSQSYTLTLHANS